MSLGLLDLPAPLWSLLDRGLAAAWLPPVARVALFGALSGWLCMWLYRRWSRQDQLAVLAPEVKAARADLAAWDGDFAGLMTRVRTVFALSGRHLRLTFAAAMLAGLPVLLVLPWLSNQFGHAWPAPGEPVRVQVLAPPAPAAPLAWDRPDQAPALRTIPGEIGPAWSVAWPAPGSTLVLAADGAQLLSLPLAAPVTVVHQRVPAWNWLVGNPAGYLAAEAPIEAITVALSPLQLHGIGPAWLRGWLAVYFIVLIVVSLALKLRWRLH
jgi:hypothetical protein